MAEEVVVDFKINADESLRVLTEINVQMAELQKEKDALDKAMKDGTATKEMVEQYTELEAAMKVLSKARKAEEKEIYNEAQQYRYAADSVQGMSDRLRQMKDEYVKMSVAERNSAKGMELAAKIKQNTAEIQAMNNVMKPNIIDQFSAKLAMLPKTLSLLKTSIKTFATQAITSIRAIGAAFAANPIGLILTAIALAVTGLIVIFKKLKGEFEKDKTATNEFKKVLAGIQPIIDALKAGFDAVVGAVVKFYTTIAKGVNWVLSLIPAFKKSQDAMVEHQKIQEQVAKSEANLAKIRRENAVKLKRVNQIISDSENYSVEERRKALDEKISLLQTEHKALLKSIDDKITEAKLNKATAKSFEEWKQASQTLTSLYEAQASANWDYVESLGDLRNEIKNLGKTTKEASSNVVEDHKSDIENLSNELKSFIETTKEEELKNLNDAYNKNKELIEKEVKDEKQKAILLKALHTRLLKDKEDLDKKYDTTSKSNQRALDLEKKNQEIQAQIVQAQAKLQDFENKIKLKPQEYAEYIQKAAEDRLKDLEKQEKDLENKYSISEWMKLSPEEQQEYTNQLNAITLARINAEMDVKEAIENTKEAQIQAIQAQISFAQEALSNVQAMTNAFGSLFSTLAEDNEELQKYANAMAYIDIMMNMAQGIASAVSRGMELGWPAAAIMIPLGISTVVGGIAQAIALHKQNKNVPSSPKFASGGLVGNQTTTRTDDSVNAKLSVGEYVIQSKVVKALGVDFLDRLNGGSGDNTNRFATGGLVPSIPTVSAIDSQVNYDQMRNLMIDALENIHPVVSVKEVTHMQQKVQVKENIARY